MNDPYLRAPHRPAAPADAHSPHAALLIDFDNVTMGIRSNLGSELRKLLDSDIIRGKVSVQRAYADWRRYPQYIASLSEASIDLIFAPAYGSTKKNATDIRLAIDALEIVFIRPEIGTFILLSGDSDFSSLVLKLKEYGKYVIGVGIQESSSDLLVQNCDEYYSYNSLSGLTSASDMKNIEKHDPWELSAKAISLMTERGDVMRSDRFKQVMLELDPSFSEKSIGFSKFNRFLTESASRGILDLHKAANGQYKVARGPRVEDVIGGGAASTRAGKSPQLTTDGNGAQKARGDTRSRRKRRDDGARDSGASRRAGRSSSRESGMATEAPPEVDEDRLRDAYELLRSVVAEKAGTDGSVRDSEVKRQMLEKDSSFDEAALGFRKFSRFLRQAHDEEVITLERGGEGNYRISVVPGSAPAATSEAPAESGDDGRRRKGRRDRRDRKDSRQPRSRKAEAETRVPDVSAVDDAPETGDAEERASASAPDSTAKPETAPEPQADAAPRASRLMGRTRRAQRPKVEGGVVPGPVDEPPSGEDKTADGDDGPKAAPAAQTPQTRSMGRFRRGSRAGTQTSGTGEKDAAKEPTSRTGSGPDLSQDQTDLVERMAREYQGVGRRTAERLVAEFGNDVLNVIDNQPERIEAILPKGRAHAVIEGRKVQREAADAS